MRAWKRILTLAVGLAAMSSFASAYYYWIFLVNNEGTAVPVPGRFDLSALPDNTVSYFISNQAPVGLVADDSLAAVYSQIRRAAAVWNDVGTSGLRVRFGGLESLGVPQATPGIDVVFDDDMPPGILAQSKPTFPADLNILSAKETTFVPILRSRLQLRANLAVENLAQPSYSDSFFLTLVHEFGHTLGLQHTMTSSVMSTSITRATKKGAPLAADDIAAISALYPGSSRGVTLANSTGSIKGRVTVDGNGVNLASVVALSANGNAVSAMTNPDGTYRIDGVPPGNYIVYAHPLPPAQSGEGSPANIITPVDLGANAYPANTHIDSRFYPGTKDWTNAGQVAVAAGKIADKIDFAMAASAGPAIYNMETYGYRAEAIAAPIFQSESSGNPIVFLAPGTVTNGGFLGTPILAPGLNVSVIGNAARIRPDSLRYYINGFVLMYVDAAKVDTPTPVSLAVTLGEALYVLPAAFTVTPKAAPKINVLTQSITEDGAERATISGDNLVPGVTQVQFDGARAALLAVNEDGSWVVAPPVAPSALQATVEAVNPDGQTSVLGLPLASRAVYTYAQRDASSIRVVTGPLAVGTDSFVLIAGTNTHFVDGHTVVGFGTSDIAVRGTWVLSPELVALNVSVRPEAANGPLTVTAVSDLELVSNSDSVQTVPAETQQISLRAPAINAATGLAGIPAGGTALVRTTGLLQDGTIWKVTVAGVAVPYTVDASGVLAIHVPELGPGPYLVEFTRADGTGPKPIVLQVDPAPPVIQSAFDNSALEGKGAPVGVDSPAKASDTITLAVAQLNPTADVWINLNGSILRPSVVGAADKNGIAAVTFVLPLGLPFNPDATQQSVPVMIGTGTRLSAPFTLLTHVDPPPPPAPAP